MMVRAQDLMTEISSNDDGRVLLYAGITGI
jgi:hypothetical protein